LEYDNYRDTADLFKVLSDPVRLQIIDLISCREMCACEILEYLSITQSTLSHHMKVLKECGLVSSRKDATWMRYSLNNDVVNSLKSRFEKITSDTAECFCYTIKEKCTK
jgi:ArsR family transcriptional regulator, arsenate/arsenite/antimonite-responsive transcriptional repressor